MKNIFMENLKGIVKTSYDGKDKPVYDWQTSIDMYLNKHKDITEGLSQEEIAAQRSAFMKYVSDKKYNKDGVEI